MNNNLIKVFCFIILLGSNFLTISQDKIKFGYHDESGNVNTKEIEENIEEEKKISIISGKLTDTIIPLLDSNTFISEIKDTILVSVLLPLYIQRNDTLMKFWKENKKDTNRVYENSELALSFLEGIMFAVDSLSDLQIPIKLQVFDTENDRDVVEKISNFEFVKQSNIVFGPIYPINFNFFRNTFHTDTNKIIINPLSHKTKFLKNNQNVYFLQPLLEQQRDSICSFIKKSEKLKNISFVYLESEIEYDAVKEYNTIKDKLDSITEFPLKKFKELSAINKRSFTFLNPGNNLVFILSEDELFIEKIIRFIRAKDTNVSVYSLGKIIDIEEDHIETLMKLGVYVPVSNYSKKNKNLQSKFESVYFHKMNKYSRLSFYSILHFCSDQEQYKFIKLFEGGGFINTDVQICTYKDYRLTPIE